MTCPKCQSENVNVQVVTVSKLKRKHSWLYWLLVGWWWEPMLWIFLTLPMLIFKIFRPKKQKIVTKQITKCVCQDCAYTWNAK